MPINLSPRTSRGSSTAHSMCALAFVPKERVPEIFDMWYNEIPDEFVPVATYFETTYKRGVPARNRRRAVRVHYAPVLWDHYNCVLSVTARTDNASEGWHNRFQVLVARRHPSIYSFLKELQKEQAAVEYMGKSLILLTLWTRHLNCKLVCFDGTFLIALIKWY